MSERVEVSPFFERGATGRDGFPAESYVTGFRGTGGEGIGVEITLPAEIVERTVLTGSRLSVSLSPEGRLVLDGEGLSDEVLEAASAAGGLSDQTLESLVCGCLNLDFLGGEEDPVGDLTALRGQMTRALSQLDATLEELRKAQTR
jgi:hypothetical protein